MRVSLTGRFISTADAASFISTPRWNVNVFGFRLNASHLPNYQRENISRCWIEFSRHSRKQKKVSLMSAEQIHNHWAVKVSSDLLVRLHEKKRCIKSLLVHNRLIWFSHRHREEALFKKDSAEFLLKLRRGNLRSWGKLPELHLCTERNSWEII